MHSIIYPHMHNCMCDNTDSPSHVQTAFPSHTYKEYVYTKTLTHSFSFLIVILTKKNKALKSSSHSRGFGIQSIAVHDEEATAVKIQLEVYGDRWRQNTSLCHPSLLLSAIQVHKYGLAHSRAWTHFLSHSELHEIHPQLYSILLTIARESFSRFHLSGQRFTAERAASFVSVGGGLPFLGIIHSHLIFISYWEIRGDKLF